MRFSVIYADPPWQYRDKAQAGARGAASKYRVMSTEWLATLPIDRIAATDCALFLWATMPMLPDALRVIEAWGFEYKTAAFVWAKKTKHGKWHFGMGNWTRANAEVCLLGVRGDVQRINAGVRSLVDAPLEEHSKKPDVVRDRIVQLLGDVPRVELFARREYPGWVCVGDELGTDVDAYLYERA